MAERDEGGSSGIVDRVALFATPVVVVELNDPHVDNDELRARLLAEERVHPGIRRSNVGGWHSVPDLARRPDKCFRGLLQRVVDHVGQLVRDLSGASSASAGAQFGYHTTAWAMTMRGGDYTVVHDHGDAHFSAVYYVDAGELDPDRSESGLLVLVDPRRSGRQISGLGLFASNYPVRPLTGKLVIFPGWLQHFVHPYSGSRPRISISFNISVEVTSLPASANEA